MQWCKSKWSTEKNWTWSFSRSQYGVKTNMRILWEILKFKWWYNEKVNWKIKWTQIDMHRAWVESTRRYCQSAKNRWKFGEQDDCKMFNNWTKEWLYDKRISQSCAGTQSKTSATIKKKKLKLRQTQAQKNHTITALTRNTLNYPCSAWRGEIYTSTQNQTQNNTKENTNQHKRKEFK